MPAFLSEAWIEALDGAVRASETVAALAPIVVEQVVTGVPGRGEVRYRMVADDRGLRVVSGVSGVSGDDPAPVPDLRITTDYPTAVALATAKENAQQALATGRLRLGGDAETVVRRAGALAALADCTAALRAETTYPSP